MEGQIFDTKKVLSTCVPCIKGTTVRKPFCTSKRRVLRDFDSDPFSVSKTSLGGANYIFTVLDDDSRLNFVFSLSAKESVP